jgi:DNA-binding HxlR family transcriptional regulator
VRRYGQFCPVAQAAEVITERWTPLVLRELLAGSHRFSDVHRGVPLMSSALLSERLKTLERCGVIERRPGPGGRGHEYHLTQAGEELRPWVELMGVWGQRWVRREVAPEEADLALLMWDMRRNINVERLPERRVVVYFNYRDAPKGKRSWWLVLDPSEEPDLCLTDPGFGVDLTVRTDVVTMAGVWMGDLDLLGAIRSRRIILEGPSPLRRAFPDWLKLNLFASVERPSGQSGPPPSPRLPVRALSDRAKKRLIESHARG